MSALAGLAVPRPGPRGTTLLLAHCTRLEQLTTRRGRSARERLETKLGGDLTRTLLRSLCGSATKTS